MPAPPPADAPTAAVAAAHPGFGRTSNPRRPALWAALALAGAVALAACGSDPAASDGPSPEALAYLDEALDVMQRESVRRLEIDWPTFRAAAIRRAGTARLPVHTYTAITETVRALGDGHSSFFPPGRIPGATDPPPTPSGLPAGRRLGERLALVFVPEFVGTNPAARAESTQAVIRRLDAEEPAPCGWIVDLRLNLGGNMYPMIAGVGPILGDGVAGQFAEPAGERRDWFYREGVAGIAGAAGEQPLVRVPAPYRLRRASPPVAVLQGPRTASSGEATAIAFRARPNSRSFGAATAGASTGNTPFELRDGAVLNLTTSIMADRAGTLFGGVVPPDEPVAGPAVPVLGQDDAVVQAAMRWLVAHPECAAGG